MKRSDIKLNVTDRIGVLNAQEIQLRARNMREVAEHRMSRFQANKESLVLIECREMAEALQRRGMEWGDLLRLIEEADMKAGRTSQQTSFFDNF